MKIDPYVYTDTIISGRKIDFIREFEVLFDALANATDTKKDLNISRVIRDRLYDYETMLYKFIDDHPEEDEEA